MEQIEKLLEIMARLRDPRAGCPWDVQQDFHSIAPYTVEEAYEVADAIEREDWERLPDELGDLLLQVVFHAQMAAEQRRFDFGDVVAAITDKLIRRHPHVFGEERVDTAEAQTLAWERHKAAERQSDPAREKLLDDVPRALPALRRAQKLTQRAATVGFDWPDLRAVRRKLDEELGELDQELARSADSPGRDRLAGELGDVLFVLCNLARHLHLDPEAALQSSNAKFVRRFEYLEQRLAEAGHDITQVPLSEMDRLWDEAKARDL